MGKSTPSAPAPPDPVKTSAAQTQSNKETALYQWGLNNPSVYTPLGSSTFTQTGGGPQYNTDAYNKALTAWNTAGGRSGPTVSRVDATGGNRTYVLSDGTRVRAPNGSNFNVGDVYGSGSNRSAMPTLEQFKIGDSAPQTRQDITLSPEQQQLYNQQTQQSIGLSNLASALQNRVGDSLNQPSPGSADFETTAKNASDAYYANQKQYLDPQWDQQQKAHDAQLAAQGIQLGSEAYNTENNNFARQKQSAYDTAQNNAILQGPQNAQQLFSLNSAARELPLNEFNALRSQSQVQMPSFASQTPTNVAGTNVLGAYNSAYQGQLNNYNQQVGSDNATTAGLFGLGGSIAGAVPWAKIGAALFAGSDRRLKTNIKLVNKKNGIKIYSFKYLGSDAVYRGVMAQDIQVTHPNAVHLMDNGFLAVDYSKIGIAMERIE